MLCLISWSCCAVGQPQTPAVLILGDSLSAGFGVDADLVWTSLLQTRLTAEGFPHRVINASISGDTTRGGLARLPKALETHRPAVVVIELGGNDGLRGISPDHSRDNLASMIDLAQASGSRIVLLGIRLPSNYGREFTEKFRRIFRELAEEKNVALVDFFLAGVAEDPSLMLADGIHPNDAAQPRLLDNVWPVLEAELANTDQAASSP